MNLNHRGRHHFPFSKFQPSWPTLPGGWHTCSKHFLQTSPMRLCGLQGPLLPHGISQKKSSAQTWKWSPHKMEGLDTPCGRETCTLQGVLVAPDSSISLNSSGSFAWTQPLVIREVFLRKILWKCPLEGKTILFMKLLGCITKPGQSRVFFHFVFACNLETQSSNVRHSLRLPFQNT